MACGVEPFTLKEGLPPDCPARAIRTTSHGVLQVTVSVCEAVPSAVNLRAQPPLNNVSFTMVAPGACWRSSHLLLQRRRHELP